MANKFVILADPTCDISDQINKEFDVSMIKGHFVTSDGKEHVSISNWDTMDRDEFYKALKKNPAAFTTSPPNIDECFVEFEKHILAGEGILCLSISSALSGTYAFMVKARELALEKYPNAEIYVLDTYRFGPSVGLMAVIASKFREKGLSLKETYDWLEENKNHFHQAGWMDDLSFVAKKGRISHAKAFFGSIVGIKPIGEFDYSGMTTVIGKGKGEKQTLDILIEYIEQTIVKPEDQIIFIATSNRHESAAKYKVLIEEKFHPLAVYVNDVFPSDGINIGPGLMAAYYYGKPISQGLIEEIELVKTIKNKVEAK